MNNVTNKWAMADEAFARGQQAYLDWCHAIAKLYAAGTATQEEIAGRYDTDQQRISKAVQVGRDERIFKSNRLTLPKSVKTIYLLTTLPDKDFEELCKPTTTQKVILEHKRRLDTPAKAKKAMENEALHNEIKARLAEKEAAAPAPAPAPITKPQYQNEYSRCNATHPTYSDKLVAKERIMQELQVLLETPIGLKILKQALSAAYHPDTGKLKKDVQRMALINQAFTKLEN